MGRPKKRKNLVSLLGLLARGGAGAGKHHNRERDLQRGRSRKRKHRKGQHDDE
jgi:hypothetical protein